MNPRRANVGHVLLDNTFLLANGTLAEGTNIPAYELAVDDVHVIWDDSADNTFTIEVTLNTSIDAKNPGANHIYSQTNVTFARFQELELQIYDLMDHGGLEGSWEATGKFWPLPPSRSRNPFRRHASVMEERRYTLDVWLRMVLVFAHRRFDQAGGPPLAKALCRFLGEEAAASLRPPPLPPRPPATIGCKRLAAWQEMARI